MGMKNLPEEPDGKSRFKIRRMPDTQAAETRSMKPAFVQLLNNIP